MNDIHVVLNATAAVFETCAKVLGSLSLRYLSIGFLFQQNMLTTRKDLGKYFYLHFHKDDAVSNSY